MSLPIPCPHCAAEFAPPRDVTVRTATCPECSRPVELADLDTRVMRLPGAGSRGSTPSLPEGPLPKGIRLVRAIAADSLGTLCEAASPTPPKRALVRVLPAEALAAGGGPAAFATRAAALCRLDHPNLVRIHRVEAAGPTAFLFADYPERDAGGRLELLTDWLARGNLTMEQVARLLRDVARGLGHAHQLRCVHGAVTPARIVVDAKGAGRVLDTGLRALVSGAGREDEWEPRFRAPERAGDGAPDPREDVFALGVLAYRLLTGVWPEGTFPAPSEANPKVPPAWDALVDRALKRRPEKRIASMEEFLRDLPTGSGGAQAPLWSPKEEKASTAGGKIKIRGGNAARAPAEPVRASAKPVVKPAPPPALAARATPPNVAHADGGPREGGPRRPPPREAEPAPTPRPARKGAAVPVIAFLLSIGMWFVARSLNWFDVPMLAIDGFEYAAKNAQGFAEYRCKKDGSLMIYVPAGEFERGSTEAEIVPLLGAATPAEQELLRLETPVQKVSLSGYLIGKHEITVGQYLAFCRETGRTLPQMPTDEPFQANYLSDARAEYPIVMVSRADALAYAEWLRMRLPTEAEWERAARGTDRRTYPWGSADNPNAARGLDAAAPKSAQVRRVKRAASDPETWATVPKDRYPQGVSPVGGFQMAGNVAEWCLDLFGPYGGPGPVRDPVGDQPGRDGVVRGGSWDSPPLWLRGASRGRVPADARSLRVGFRCAVTVNIQKR